MVVGKFNYHQILFTLETYLKIEEKLSFLFEVKIEVNKVIQCFVQTKFQPLRNYITKNKFTDDGCDELTEFLQKVAGFYNSPLYSNRFLSDEILKRHLREEVLNYKKFVRLIDAEITYWIEQREKENNKNTLRESTMREQENFQDEIEEQQSKFKDEKPNQMENSTSIRELKEKQRKIVWKGSKEDLIYFFDQLYGLQLLKVKGYDEIFSIVSHYFISESGEPMFVEKSASSKMNLTGPKIPEGYQRYMRGIEKLKANEK
ncbi:MAG: hypothetical protein HYS24_02425 [Ignavibacteriales bacterium]|nr:hypothetical protein [Ignavibacteriales bacterium]MBK7980057.1 hypothetical protein [Ignavibacteriota bacterium]